MAITEYKSGSASISTNEYSLVTPGTSLATDTTDGVYQVFIDFSAMVANDQYEIKIYEKVISSGTKQVIYDSILTGAMAAVWVSPSLLLMNGWDVTVQRLAGADRTIAWSIRQVA